MGRLRAQQPPRYPLFKPRGLAYVRLNGANVHLGKWQSPESYEAYAKVIAG